MLIDESNENRKTKQNKTNLGLISKKSIMHGQHTFFAHFFVLALHDYNVKLSGYTFYGGNVVCSHKKFCCLCSCSLSFSLPLIFTILAANISHLLTTAYNFHVVFLTKSVSFLFNFSLQLLLCYPRQRGH